MLERGNWPGNGRELVKVIGKGILISHGNELKLPDEYLDEHQHLQGTIENIIVGMVFELDKTMWLLEKLLIERLLGVTQNNQSHARFWHLRNVLNRRSQSSLTTYNIYAEREGFEMALFLRSVCAQRVCSTCKGFTIPNTLRHVL